MNNISFQKDESIQAKERAEEKAKYNQHYFENVYWAEDFPDDPTHEKRFGFLSDILTKHFDFETFLDAGLGTGQVTRNLIKKGYDGRANDVSEYALKTYSADLLEKNIAVLAGIEEMPFNNYEFDMVFCSDVLEHIPDFDTEFAIGELVRVSNNFIVLTINMNRKYEYHPTIMPREEWEERFLRYGVRQLTDLQNKIEEESKIIHPEYDFFIFQKL